MKSINPNGRPRLPMTQIKSKVIAARFSLLEYKNIKKNKNRPKLGMKMSQNSECLHQTLETPYASYIIDEAV